MESVSVVYLFDKKMGSMWREKWESLKWCKNMRLRVEEKKKNLGSVDGNDVAVFLCEVVPSSWNFGSVEC